MARFARRRDAKIVVFLEAIYDMLNILAVIYFLYVLLKITVLGSNKLTAVSVSMNTYYKQYGISSGNFLSGLINRSLPSGDSPLSKAWLTVAILVGEAAVHLFMTVVLFKASTGEGPASEFLARAERWRSVNMMSAFLGLIYWAITNALTGSLLWFHAWKALSFFLVEKYVKELREVTEHEHEQ